MLCKKPYVMKGASFGCGQCMPCRLNRRRIWTHRLCLEAATHAASSFVTLTYDRKHLPEDGSVRPVDLQLWLKRFREGYGRIRFFGVGEYGDASWRPHYHVALFGAGPESADVVRRTWGQGFTYTGTLTLHSAQYVAGYVTKKMTKVDDERLKGRHPEFARMSLRPGIGAPAVSDIVRSLSTDVGRRSISDTGDVPKVLRHGSRNMPLGRYMRGRIRDAIGHRFIEDNPDECFRRTAELLNLYKDYLMATDSPLSLEKWQAAREAQKVLNLEARARIYGQRSRV